MCNEKIDTNMDTHVNECLDKQILKDDVMDKGYLELTDIQKKAIIYCSKKAKLHERDTKHIVLTKLLELGYTTDDYVRCNYKH